MSELLPSRTRTGSSMISYLERMILLSMLMRRRSVIHSLARGIGKLGKDGILISSVVPSLPDWPSV
jgi:hypothetical protein